MASTEESPFRGLVLSWPAIGAFLVAVWGLIVARPQLESPRPTPPLSRTPGEKGSALARLWQDPLAAALNQAAEEAPQLPEQAFLRPVNDLLSHDPKPKSILFLLVCINPQNTPEHVESRRRERYATLSALSTAGYVPDQAERICYVKLPRNLGESPASGVSLVGLIGSPLGQGPFLAASALIPARGFLGGPATRDAFLIPHELVRPPELVQVNLEPTPTHFGAVCVLWLSEDLGEDYG